MSEPERTSNSEWPTWKCALFTGSICAIPLSLPIVVYPVAGLSILAGLLLLFVGLLKFFGTGFVVEGGCLVIILAVLLFTSSPGLFTWLYGEGVAPDPGPATLVSLVVLAAMGVVFVWFGLSLVRDLRRLSAQAERPKKPEDK